MLLSSPAMLLALLTRVRTAPAIDFPLLFFDGRRKARCSGRLLARYLSFLFFVHRYESCLRHPQAAQQS